MSRYSRTDIAALGPAARVQVEEALKLAYAGEAAVSAALDVSQPTPRKTKYRNQPVVFEGKRFDSKAELARYLELRRQQTAGLISSLIRQREIPITVNGVTVCRYVADFYYVRDGREVYEDVKGFRTATYSLKKRLLSAFLGIEIDEIPA